MAQVGIDPMIVSVNAGGELESIINRIEGERQKLYALARVYIGRDEDIEDVFYHSIIALHRQTGKRKRRKSITSVFLENCRRIAGRSGTSEGEDAFKVLRQLDEADKDAVALVYLKGCTQEETADLLDITIDEVKARLYRGIRKLREDMGFGTAFKGCEHYQKHYVDYLGRTMDRPEKVDFEIHIYHCSDCQDDLASYQEVTFALEDLIRNAALPAGFMERIRSRLNEREARREKRKKKRKSIWLSVAGVFALLICTGFVTGGFAKLYYSYTEEFEPLRPYLQHNLAERLDLVSESEGVKITIKSVVADDMQTLVFYEIEDTEEDNRYIMQAYEGVYIENELDVMDMEKNPQDFSMPVDQDEIHNEHKNIYRGTMKLRPVGVDKGTIKMNVARLMKLNQDPTLDEMYARGAVFAEGDWSFEIPFEKQSSQEHTIDKEIDLDGIKVRIDKLTIAPTSTVVQYSFQNQQGNARVELLLLESLSDGKNKVVADMYGSNIMDVFNTQENWTTLSTSFDSFYFDKPEELDIKFNSLHLSVEDQQDIKLPDPKDLPTTFEYAGSAITINEITEGNPAKVSLTLEVTEDRIFEQLNYGFHRDYEQNESISFGMNGEGVLMDKDGNIHEMGSYEYNPLDRPRYFEKTQELTLHNESSDADVSIKTINIDGYTTTKYVDDHVKVTLD